MTPFVIPPAVPLENLTRALDDPALAKRAYDEINKLPMWLSPLLGRLEKFEVQPGSRFELDDSLKPVEPPSDQVYHLLRSAHDHWQALCDAINTGMVRPLAGYTLVRSAIEASALAAWLMQSPLTDRRLRNSIRLSLENRKDTETFTRRVLGANKNSAAITKWFRAEMTATKDQRPGTRSLGLDQNFPTLTSILTETDRQMAFSGITGLDAWRACSGFAHSNAHFAGGTLIRIEAVDSVQVTGRLTNLWMMITPAQKYFEYSLGLAEKWSAPTPGKGRANP